MEKSENAIVSGKKVEEKVNKSESKSEKIFRREWKITVKVKKGCENQQVV